MAQLMCPSCGAGVVQRSASLPYVVCGYCRTVIRWSQLGAQAVGTTAELPFDVSPIQLGTGGAVDGTRFQVVGRVRWGWADGAWNEWLLALSDDTQRWLGEAMGQFQILSERADIAADPLLASFAQGGTIARGQTLTVDGRAYVAADTKQVACLGSEGSLPFATPAGHTMTSVDFREAHGAALSVQREAAGVSVWIGTYVELADLRPSRLRQVEGWAIPADLA